MAGVTVVRIARMDIFRADRHREEVRRTDGPDLDPKKPHGEAPVLPVRAKAGATRFGASPRREAGVADRGAAAGGAVRGFTARELIEMARAARARAAQT